MGFVRGSARFSVRFNGQDVTFDTSDLRIEDVAAERLTIAAEIAFVGDVLAAVHQDVELLDVSYRRWKQTTLLEFAKETEQEIAKANAKLRKEDPKAKLAEAKLPEYRLMAMVEGTKEFEKRKAQIAGAQALAERLERFLSGLFEKAQQLRPARGDAQQGRPRNDDEVSPAARKRFSDARRKLLHREDE